MIATADSFGRIIDCRYLCVRAAFYQLSDKQILKLTEEVYEAIHRLFADRCVLSWQLNNKALNKPETIARFRVSESPYLSCTVLGDVVSTAVYNKTTQKKYENTLEYHPAFSFGTGPSFASYDYPTYCAKELEPHSGDPIQFRAALNKLFSEENRINLRQYRDHDMAGGILAYRDEILGTSNYSGTLDFRISLFSLDNEVDEIAIQLDNLSRSIFEQYRSINITIGIDQTGHDFERYFGRLTKDNIENEYYHALNLRARYLYLNHIGWANYVSPTVASLGIQLGDINKKTLIEPIPGTGGLYIQCGKAVSDVSIAALKRLKVVMYPMLLPSGEDRPLCFSDNGFFFFRENWENVPILDEEITIEDTKVRISTRNQPDKDYLLNSF